MDDPIYIKYLPDLVTYNSNQIKTKEYQTTVAKYLIFNSDDMETGNYNSIITCPETKKILCFSPPKSMEYNEFIEKNPEITDDILVNEIVEGTMLNLFYDPRISSWEIATRGAVGGNYWYYRNQYSVGKYKTTKQITFRKMFLEVFSAQEGDDINNLAFLEYLPKDYCYTFILQHPVNHIIKTVTSPVVYLVAVYHLIDNNVISIPPTVFEEWNCFLGVRGLIEFPTRFNEETYDELQKYDSSDYPGIMFYNLKTGDRTLKEYPKYTNIKELRGNNPNIQYHYLILRSSGKVDEFLSVFPCYKGLFYEFYKQYNNFIQHIHQCYISYYVKKTGQHVSKKYFPLVYKVHHELFLPYKETEKLIMKKEVITEFIKKIHPKELIFYLNYRE